MLGVGGGRLGLLKFGYMLSLLREVFRTVSWRPWKCMEEQDVVLPFG